MRSITIGIGLLLMLACGNLPAQTPKLPVITSVPPSQPYRWDNVVIRAGGFVSGLEFSPKVKGLVYARTDVGGAYRSEDAGEHWTPLNDRFGRDDVTYLGIEGIGLDPEDGNKLYLAEGMYTGDWGGPSAIFRSKDRGRTFEKAAMPFKMGGNDDGRGVGPRLSVDPNLGSVLYFGSRKAGLWKSDDGAVTWKHVDSFPVPDKLTGVGALAGITFVVFDASTGTKSGATKTIYAGVAQTGNGLYRSQDAGKTWEPVPGAPKEMFPNHVVFQPGGAIYFSYADNIGPNGIKNGAIWKYTSADGKWKDITPLKPNSQGVGSFGYASLGIDAEHPQTLMAGTIDRWGPGDKIFRTTDGGKTWKDMEPLSVYAAPETPWTYWHRPTTGGHGWMSDILIDPFDSGRVLYTTGEGIWGSTDVTAADAGKEAHWSFPDVGLEETVPLAIVSPPEGAHLISAVGDIGGFRHEDLTRSPKDGFFTNPQMNTNRGLDFAALAPAIVVRVGDGVDGKVVRGGYSLDNGVTWKPFDNEPPSSQHGSGSVAISADGKVVVWIPRKGLPYSTMDWGKSWLPCRGLTEEMRVVSDRVNPAKFYSYNPGTGQLLESLDGAQNFALRTEPVSTKGDYAAIAATPGIEGDIWVATQENVYHSSDSGVTFVQLEGMKKAHIGFGMAAPGKKTPAIYINGTAAGTEGTFRSDDGGASWVRIDDPEHQFGWQNEVIGDPRVYGRVYLATGGRGIIYGEPSGSAGGMAGR
jgi:photosystem II stability/assembly factor-like uncharacterized protein